MCRECVVVIDCIQSPKVYDCRNQKVAIAKLTSKITRTGATPPKAWK